jgi:hypothetical protein
MWGLKFSAKSPQLNNSNKETKQHAGRCADSPSSSFLTNRRLYRCAEHETTKKKVPTRANESPVDYDTYCGLLLDQLSSAKLRT